MFSMSKWRLLKLANAKNKDHVSTTRLASLGASPVAYVRISRRTRNFLKSQSLHRESSIFSKSQSLGESSAFFQVPEPIWRRQLEQWHFAFCQPSVFEGGGDTGILPRPRAYIEGKSSELFKSRGHFLECDVIRRGGGLGNFRIRGGIQGLEET